MRGGSEVCPRREDSVVKEPALFEGAAEPSALICLYERGGRLLQEKEKNVWVVCGGAWVRGQLSVVRGPLLGR